MKGSYKLLNSHFTTQHPHNLLLQSSPITHSLPSIFKTCSSFKTLKVIHGGCK
ncbi:hypothetical protein Hanom_Chr06g00535951 [Helianthus anomalus]